jgi:hypothetical protein
MKGSLWRAPGAGSSSGSDRSSGGALEELFTLPELDGKLQHVAWSRCEDNGGKQSILSVHDNTMRVWDMDSNMTLTVGAQYSKQNVPVNF